MSTAPYTQPSTVSPLPLKRGVFAALLLGTVLARLASFWSRV